VAMHRLYAMVLLFVALPATTSLGQRYPDRPVTLIVPFAAGGPVDVMSRIVTDRMGQALGQQVVVENVAGGGGIVGTVRVRRANPDGYTLIAGNLGTHAAAAALNPSLPYDPSSDFEPIGLLASTSVLLLARKDLPPSNLTDFVEYVRTNSDRVNMAHAGVGSSSHITGLLLNRLIGAAPTLIPYGGTGPAMNALIAGQVDYMCDVITNALPQIEAGTIKAYLIATPERSAMLPSVPTSAEAGIPVFLAPSWVALFAPKGTPPLLLEKLSAALDAALDDQNVRLRLTELGNTVPTKDQRGSDSLAGLVKRETAKWAEAIKATTSQ
jgi:tripartite-type tricarboxylate transporter receptor subunit TctC